MTDDSDKCPVCGAVSPSKQSAVNRVIDRFGGAKVLSEAIDIHVSAIYRWDYPKEKHGSEGCIPSFQHKKILAAAKKLGIELKPEELVNV